MNEGEECHSRFRLHLPGFDGSMDDLLALTENWDISPEEISMASLTQQFAEHLDSSGDLDLDATGDFLRAAARLLVIKSERLLPQPEPEREHDGPARELEATIDRAALFEAARRLGEHQGRESFSAPHREIGIERRFEPRALRLLERVWAEMQRRQAAARVHVATPTFVRLEAALSHLVRRMQSHSVVAFGRLLGDANRQEAVVHFLAVLELIRRGQARASQDGLFDEIIIKRVEGEREPASRAG